jgi:purine-nucleoside phosphorylase
MRVLALSVVTDLCFPDALEPADIARILAVAGRAEPSLRRLIIRVMERL